MRRKRHMKKLTALILCLLSTTIVACGPYGTIYGVAVEERKTTAIAEDKKISLTIQKAFVEDSDVKALDISPYCYNGHVYLVGEYDVIKQKEKAIAIAKGVEGVKSVETYIVPKKKNDTCGTTDNVAIRAKLDAKLIKDKEIWSTNIDVQIVQCKVILLGVVKTKKEIDKAVAHAKSVEGVRGVTSYLKSTQ
jgi:hyperosmotically inducible periplasmic protein